jgi:hypothetical protein
MNDENHSRFDEHFPSALKLAELGAINERREQCGVESGEPLVGLALSGGGIRSATFCLGLFQALARQRLIRRIDYMSTVSGGGYFGGFLGASFSRPGASPDSVEAELANNHSWSVKWLRENGRFLSPNGAGDTWLSAAVALRNWTALQVVLLTFSFMVLGFGVLIRANLWTGIYTGSFWSAIEQFFWAHPFGGIWGSPWLVLPLIPFFAVMLPTGTLYWLTQWVPLMHLLRRGAGVFSTRLRSMTNDEFAGRAQHALSRLFMLGLIPAVALLCYAAIDSLGQTVYLRWSANDFAFPSLWAMLTGAGVGLFGFAARVAVYLEKLIGKRSFRVPSNVVALGLALLWALLIVLALSVAACGFAWEWGLVWTGSALHNMSGGWPLMLAVAICLVASWIFSRAFGFVNLSSLQQVYAARLARAYLGATNPERRASENHSMTDLIGGDDVRLDAYRPDRHGGPLHLINITVNETISGKTQIERRDRKGFIMAIGPCGLSAGRHSHALWAVDAETVTPFPGVQALFEKRQRSIVPIPCPGGSGCFHILSDSDCDGHMDTAAQRIEALTVGRWVAVSGAAFTTGTGANTHLGLSFLLGLGNVRLGYWWDSGIVPQKAGRGGARPNFLELASRVMSRVLPVQACLMNEFFARFHGPARRHWYLSDGGHFENTACYELIRRRVPFIICSDAGQDPQYDFADFANLVRKARIDFGAEIQVVRRRSDKATDDPGVRFPMPKLDDLLHPGLRDVIGTPEDFTPLGTGAEADGAEPSPPRRAQAHAILARIHYTDTDEFSWLLLIKPSLMGDEATDVLQYQRSHPLFPHEPTSDQYFDEGQWESYRKLGEHVGTELFTPPSAATTSEDASWSPSQMCPPLVPQLRATSAGAGIGSAEIRELRTPASIEK